MDPSLFPIISGFICLLCIYLSLKVLITQMQYESEVLSLRRDAHELRTNYMNRLKSARPVPKESTGLAEPWPDDDDVSDVEDGHEIDAEIEAKDTADDGVLLV